MRAQELRTDRGSNCFESHQLKRLIDSRGRSLVIPITIVTFVRQLQNMPVLFMSFIRGSMSEPGGTDGKRHKTGETAVMEDHRCRLTNRHVSFVEDQKNPGLKVRSVDCRVERYSPISVSENVKYI